MIVLWFPFQIVRRYWPRGTQHQRSPRIQNMERMFFLPILLPTSNSPIHDATLTRLGIPPNICRHDLNFNVGQIGSCKHGPEQACAIFRHHIVFLVWVAPHDTNHLGMPLRQVAQHGKVSKMRRVERASEDYCIVLLFGIIWPGPWVGNYCGKNEGPEQRPDGVKDSDREPKFAGRNEIDFHVQFFCSLL